MKSNISPWSTPTGLLEEVLVQAPLRGDLGWVVVLADPELEVAHVVGRQLDPDLDGLALLVLPDDDPLAEGTAGFVGAGLE